MKLKIKLVFTKTKKIKKIIKIKKTIPNKAVSSRYLNILKKSV